MSHFAWGIYNILFFPPKHQIIGQNIYSLTKPAYDYRISIKENGDFVAIEKRQNAIECRYFRRKFNDETFCCFFESYTLTFAVHIEHYFCLQQQRHILTGIKKKTNSFKYAKFIHWPLNFF